MDKQASTEAPRRPINWLIGRPLPSAAAQHQTIGKAVGLAVFASDALSSTAYATQEILVILVVAGTAAFSWSMPIALTIVALLIVVTISYQQTLHAYPTGGGAYIVAHENLGQTPAQIAGAALLTDYVLTVAVSATAGVAQLVSAFPQLEEMRVLIAIALVFFVMVINLRGVKESGTFFAIPTYFFLGAIFLTLAVGMFRFFFGELGMVDSPPHFVKTLGGTVTLVLILRAFANGTTALTGIEAISNGIMAFKEPRSRNASATLLWMAAILGILFLGITFLALQIGAVPSEAETVISQIVRTVFSSRGFPYLLVIASTTVILIMAANTAFADFPRLAALMAKDSFLPRQFSFQGSRLVFSWGIFFLAILASALIAVFNASVTLLIPLYAVGVFLSFTLSQMGMVRHWWQLRSRPSSPLTDRKWLLKLLVNAIGAVATGVVAVIFAITKFADGAWIILVVLPLLVLLFRSIHAHYADLANNLSLANYQALSSPLTYKIILPLQGVHRGSLKALHYASAVSDDIVAVHISIDEQESQRVHARWERWGQGVRLVIIESPYRLLFEPLLQFIRDAVSSVEENQQVLVVVPEFVPRHWWHRLLHMNTATLLRLALLTTRDVTIMEVPYRMR